MRRVERKAANFETIRCKASGGDKSSQSGRQSLEVRSPDGGLLSIKGEAQFTEDLGPMQEGMASSSRRSANDAIINVSKTLGVRQRIGGADGIGDSQAVSEGAQGVP